MILYVTLHEEKIEVLDRRVESYTNQGWKLHGNQYAVRDEDRHITTFYQPVVRVRKKPKN